MISLASIKSNDFVSFVSPSVGGGNKEKNSLHFVCSAPFGAEGLLIRYAGKHMMWGDGMPFLYAMSDIHGYLDVLQANLKRIDLTGENRLVLLGDYIDYGPESGQTLRFIYELEHSHEAGKVVVLRGNHEEMLLEWLEIYTGPNAGKPDADGLIPYHEWLKTDRGFRTFRSLVAPEQWDAFCRMSGASEDEWNQRAADMVLAHHGELIAWLRTLPYYYETEKQIFVHAGIDEELSDWWRQGTEKSVFIGKYPASTGRFDKDIIAGHIATSSLARDPDFHGVWHDGKSHWYIDGTVDASGKIPILAFDQSSGQYRELFP